MLTLYSLFENFVDLMSISLSRVKERNAAVIGRADDVDHLRAVRSLGRLLAAHVLNAQPDRRHLKRAQPSTLRQRV